MYWSDINLRFLWCRLIDFRQKTLQLGPVAHQLVVDPISFVQQGVDVSYSLQEKNKELKYYPKKITDEKTQTKWGQLIFGIKSQMICPFHFHVYQTNNYLPFSCLPHSQWDPQHNMALRTAWSQIWHICRNHRRCTGKGLFHRSW